MENFPQTFLNLLNGVKKTKESNFKSLAVLPKLELLAINK